ncbi:PREDICTED: uncharacterized protein LOC104703903 isoform X1 [Camelina sativa]|uniref:Uncharacterized protein LOC104703903 isoform X1 n=1 Tax=Camelina sativa TaxID=90675 RepID=A0ABM0SZ98_CAMSA|nr:PREDICTED: uncharacterized protein LOC104703903 isoform X1 [Camelina sativa]
MKKLNIIINGMEMIWRTVVSTFMLFFFLRYFNNPPNPLLIFLFLCLVLFLLVIDRNRSVYEENEDSCVLYTFEEDSMLDGENIDKNRDCCNLPRYYYDDSFGYYDGYHEVDDDEDCSQWNQDGGDDGVENHDDDHHHSHGDDDDDTLTSRIEDYIANVYNGWREENRTEKLFV